MKILNKTIMIIMVLGMAIAFAFTGCSESKESSSASAGSSSDTSKVVVAEVNGKPVYKSEYLQKRSQYLNYYGLSESDLKDEQYADTAKTIKQYAFNSLIEMKVALAEAEKEGKANLTDAEKDKLYQDFVKEQKDSIREQLKSSTEESASASASASVSAETSTSVSPSTSASASASESTDPELEKQVDSQFAQMIKKSGYTEESLKQYVLDYHVYEQLYKDSVASATVNDKDIQSYYDEQLKTQQQDAKDNEETAASNYANGYSSYDVKVYIPAGLRYVKHILIGFPADVQTEISDDISNDQQKKADDLMKTELKKIEPKAQEALQKVKAGEDFDQLIKEYGSDPGMTSGQNPDGYLICKGSKMVEGFLNAALKLKNPGDISDLVSSEYGYHIIKYEKALKEGAIPLDQVKSDIESVLKTDAEKKLWSSKVEQWEKDFNVKTYEDRL